MAKRNDDRFDVSEYPEELRPKARKVLEKRWDNVQRVGRLEQVGVGLDVGTARVEFLMQSLAEFGIITQEQLLEMAWSWEENMALQLAQLEDQVQMRMQRAQEEQERMIREAKLTQGQGPQEGLLLPGGRIHLPKPDQAQPPVEGTPDE